MVIFFPWASAACDGLEPSNNEVARAVSTNMLSCLPIVNPLVVNLPGRSCPRRLRPNPRETKCKQAFRSTFNQSLTRLHYTLIKFSRAGYSRARYSRRTDFHRHGRQAIRQDL